MSLIDEEWEQNEYQLKGGFIEKKITQSHRTKEKDLNLGFITYNANMNVPCFKYDMMLRTCINNYGVGTREFLTNKHCYEAYDWFQKCVHNNKMVYTIKKYYPDNFLNSAEAFSVYSLKDVI
jgi:hypothetical protein